MPPDASGRVRFGASGFLNGAKAAHHSLRIVRWWCKGPHRAISPPSALDLVDFVDFVVQRHTPGGNFPDFCGLGELVDLGNFWTWGTFPILNREHSIFYKLHTITVSDSVGSLLILLSLIIRFPQYWPLLVVTALSLSLWNTISSYILGNISDRKL